MKDRSKRITHCSVPGHGTECIVAEEISETERERRNRQRRRDERKIIEEELREVDG